MYSTNKLVYLSPQFYGVDFGLSYRAEHRRHRQRQRRRLRWPGPVRQREHHHVPATVRPRRAATRCRPPARVTTPAARTPTKASSATAARSARSASSARPPTSAPAGCMTAASSGPRSIRSASPRGPEHRRLRPRGHLWRPDVGAHYEFGRYTVQGGGGPGGLITKGQPNSNAYQPVTTLHDRAGDLRRRGVRELVSGQPAGGDQPSTERAPR